MLSISPYMVTCTQLYYRSTCIATDGQLSGLKHLSLVVLQLTGEVPVTLIRTHLLTYHRIAPGSLLFECSLSTVVSSSVSPEV